MTSRKCAVELGDVVDRDLLQRGILLLHRDDHEVGVLVEEVAVFLGNSRELTDHLRGEWAAEVGDEIGRALDAKASTSSAHTESTSGSSADPRRAQHRREDLAHLGVAGGVRLAELQLVGRASVFVERPERRLRGTAWRRD